MTAEQYQALHRKPTANDKVKSGKESTEPITVALTSQKKPVSPSMPIDEQREAYRCDWHSRQIPDNAVMIADGDNEYTYRYEVNGNVFEVRVQVKLIRK